LRAVKILLALIGDIPRLLLEEVAQFYRFFLCLRVILLEGSLEGGDLLSYAQEFLLAGVEVGFGEFLEDVGANEMNEIGDLLAPSCIFVAERVEDDAAVDVDVLAKGVALESVTRVDDW
jgi:hypothetical protein